MKNLLTQDRQVKKDYTDLENYFLLGFLSFLSSLAFFLAFFSGKLVDYADTMSRLDIARKVIDNLHPGFAQFGNVWLPLPQMLMVPFIWSNYLWHSGIAGSFMSMPMYVISGFYIFKTVKMLSHSFLTAFFSMCIYALNTNMLFLQTTAMSESLFLCTISAALYYFIKWVTYRIDFDLIPAALAVSAMSYTRYEGLAILFSSIPMVFVMSILMRKKYKVVEGNTIIYAFLALTGFAAWTLYLWAIFGDPLYWLHFYAGASSVTVSANTTVQTYLQHKPFLAAFWEYFTSFTWMIGLIPTYICGLGLFFMTVTSIWKRKLYILPLLMPLSVFLFMILTLQKNTPIVQPELTLFNILSQNTSLQTGFNIRYGIMLLPWAAVICSYVFSVVHFKQVKVLLFTLFLIQTTAYIFPRYTLLYNITANKYTTRQYPYLVDWMKAHYSGGEILMSATSHEDEMFKMGFDYKAYIHEGAGTYWNESLDNPSRYARYVILDFGHPDDVLTPYFKNNPHRQGILDRDYTLVFNDIHENVLIYKKKTNPYYII